MTFYELPGISATLLIMHLTKLILIIVFVFPASVLAEKVYKTRDAEGNIIFSDIPNEGAEEIKIQEAQTLDIPMPKRTGERRTTKLSPKAINYTQFKIINPEHDSTIHSNEGVVSIVAELSPELDEKHVIVFLMDGKELSESKSLQFSAESIERGTHNVIAIIKDEEDNVIKRSDKATFHLRKASKLFKNRVNAEGTNNPVVAPAAPLL